MRTILIGLAASILLVRCVLPLLGISYARWGWREAKTDLDDECIEQQHMETTFLSQASMILAEMRLRNTTIVYMNQIVWLLTAVVVLIVLVLRWLGWVSAGLWSALGVALLPNIGYIVIEASQLWGTYKAHEDRVHMKKLTRQAREQDEHRDRRKGDQHGEQSQESLGGRAS